MGMLIKNKYLSPFKSQDEMYEAEFGQNTAFAESSTLEYSVLRKGSYL